MSFERFKMPWLWHSPVGTVPVMFALREAWRRNWGETTLYVALGVVFVLVSRALRQARADERGMSIPSWGDISWSEVTSARLYWRGAALVLRDQRTKTLPKSLLNLPQVQASIRAAMQTVPALSILVTEERRAG